MERERAISLEPSCSNRRNLFEDEHTSRKRQRVSREESRSRSVDTANNTDIVPDSLLRKAEQVEEPRLPTESTSKVTINLRASQLLDCIPSSPPSPTSPSKMLNGGDGGTRMSVESESDNLSTVPAIETPSSSGSAPGSPTLEILPPEDEDDIQVAIITDDGLYSDPISTFPYHSDEETACDTVQRLARYWQFDEVVTDESFRKVNQWLLDYLRTHSQLDLFYEMYTRNREFWAEIPSLLWALSYRSKFFGEFLKRNTNSRRALTGVFIQFARLTGKFVGMDVRVLSKYAQNGSSEKEPELASRPYLHALSFLLRNKADGSHIGHNLEVHYGWNFDEDIADMSESFEKEGGSIRSLTQWVKGRLVNQSDPKSLEDCTTPSNLVAQAVGEADHELDRRVPDGFTFFKVMSAGLETIIDKHITFLSQDSAQTYIRTLPEILRRGLCRDISAARDICKNSASNRSMLEQKHLPDVISKEWKFTILKKLITSAQMQLRVVGVTTMCTDLLSLHNSYKGHDASTSPVLLYFAEFILANQLIDYLVGLGSHPEIISESSNILGFLVVTKTYKPSHTDKIWQTVMTSQDPRVVEAILRMLIRSLNLYDYQGLTYLCRKLFDVPIESFTLPMREYCSVLIKEFINRAKSEGLSFITLAPYSILVRLIKESSIVSPGFTARYPEVHLFAASRLANLLPHGPASDSRKEIYTDCIQDISAKTPTAGGSLCVINILLKQNATPDIRLLTGKHGLTELLVEDIELSVRSGLYSAGVKNIPANNARRELLLSIILLDPDTITPELGRRLWNVLVGADSKGSSERESSWQILNGVANRSSIGNAFLASCFEKYLPTLPPHCFTQGALDFVREAMFAWLNQLDADDFDEQCFNSQALELTWRMILTAPPATIDQMAISMLVEVYVDSHLILNLPRLKARTVHLALVDRCLRQLKGAAANLKTFSCEALSGSDEAMVIVASEDQFCEQETTFARSLAVLREFLAAYESKPHFATPKSRLPIMNASSAVEGEPMTVKYQSFDGDKHTEVKSLTLGRLNTAASLFATLQKATGFQNYKVYCAGKEFDPDEFEVCRSLDDLKLNGLVLVQRREDANAMPSHLANNRPTLEVEITKHFDALWGYLGMHEKVAKEIYVFLQQFPVYSRLIAEFEGQTAYSEIFPAGQPFKSLYALHALREYISLQSRQADLLLMDTKAGALVANRDTLESALTRAISLVVAAISDQNVMSQCATDDLRDYLALQMIDCLVSLLREPLLPESIASLLDDTLLQRLLSLLYDAKQRDTAHNSIHLTWRTVEAILEASSHNAELWQAFVTHLNTNTLLSELILEDSRPIVRRAVVKQIANKCNNSLSLAQVSTISFATTFWPMVATLVPLASLDALQCEETFSLAHAIFKRIAESSIDSLKLEKLVNEWGTLLLAHSCQENIGHHDSIDYVAYGLTQLLFCAASFAKASQQQLSCGPVAAKLFRKHLFPELSPDDDSKIITPKLPMLNPTTRHTLAETIYSLVKEDEAQYRVILEDLSSLVPYNSGEEGPYVYDMSHQFERSKWIRSPTGYVGLRNLSNTCYLNSLFTQLFMNVPFRNFMLGANVADGAASQKLLAETQNLFSYMQNSLKRFVDPTELAGSIRTYEETPIDVTIQMDVDEFYNLLFDRWESQILAEEDKKKFRSFYGGQLVQQVKSKECPHISERLEPFSAIQCDIKGKSCLQESLQAYVDGEIMEGDNKYKCSTCDRHVDAVKRACLKDIPDNLIFHLKRFDFNLRTLQRSKINDHFSFPTKIDMRPYKVEYLMDHPEGTAEDLFELVGILVHSGTAESGHYYSFIRERPSKDEAETWLEFNDDSVTPWDPGFMESSCFGGTEYRNTLDSNNVTFDKSWSGYMLFYQRSAVAGAQKDELLRSGLTSPVRLPVPIRLANQITQENEILLRRHCLYDPSHAPFVIKMMSNIRNVNGGSCSATHNLEKLALTASLNHLDQVIARTKDLPDFQSFMLALKQLYASCGECSHDYLDWYCDQPETMRHLLVRNPEGLVRSEIAATINDALDKVSSDASYAYGFDEEEDAESADGLDGGDPLLVQRLVQTLNKIWEIFHTNCRAWPEYFGLLNSIAKRGPKEAALILDAGYLRKTLEIISADPVLPITQQYHRMLNVISKRLSTRPVSFDAVIALLRTLIEACDPSDDPINDQDERPASKFVGESRMPLTQSERHLLTQHWTRNQAHILTEKLLALCQNRRDTEKILIKLLQWPESLDSYIVAAIVSNIRRPASAHPVGAFLQAAYIYCMHSQHPRALSIMIQNVSKAAESCEGSEGKDFLAFFKRIYSEALDFDEFAITNKEPFQCFFDCVAIWAPTLLTSYDSLVRQDTQVFLSEIMLEPKPEDLEDAIPTENEVEKEMMINAAVQRLGQACLDYADNTYIHQRQQAVKALLESLETVIDACDPFFTPREHNTNKFNSGRNTILPNIRKFMVDEPDEEVSDWDGSDADYDESSEALDGVPDFGTGNDDDIQL